jgi:hypothetical protein
MKTCLLTIQFILLLASSLYAQSPATVIIIGVNHGETRYMNTDSLLQILQSIKPHVILDEMQYPSGYYTRDKQLRNPPLTYRIRAKLGIGRKISPEKRVLYAYRKKDPAIIIKPFDIYIENRKDYVLKDRKWDKQFIEIVNNDTYANSFSPYQQALFQEYARLHNYLYDLVQQTYLTMNQPDVSDSLRKMVSLSDPFIRSILDSVPAASSLKPFYEMNSAFWKERNETMAKNILDYIKEYPGKRIVVLTGLLHKYYLEDLLRPAATLVSPRSSGDTAGNENQFVLKEFYQVKLGD